MKKIPSLLLIFSFFIAQISYGQCLGDIVLFTQQEVDDYVTNYGCGELEGDLIIGDGSGSNGVPSDITNLDGLALITSIEGSFRITSNDLLLDLQGLQNLVSVGGDFNISVNDNMTSLSGLDNLTSIQGDLRIQFMDALIDLSGLENLVFVGEKIDLNFNDSLVSLSGLENISVVENGLVISNSNALISLKGLDNVTSVGDILAIYNCSNLITLSYLSSLTEVAGDVSISNCSELHNLSGLQSLISIDNELKISYCNSLNNLYGLQNIEFIGGDLRIFNNPNLNDCCQAINLLEVTLGDYSLNYNAAGCTTLNEIINACSSVNLITKAFYDVNQNDIKDGTEQFLSTNFTLSPLAIYSFTNDNYESLFYLDAFGDYTLSINNNPLWQLNSGFADSLEIAVLDDSFMDSLYLFPLSPTIEIISQDIDITSSITRCNQSTNYWLTYTNTGTIETDGYVQLIPDEIVNFVSANPPVDSMAGDTLYWFYENLHPTHSNQILIVYEMPGVDELGTMIDFEANIETWEGLGDDKAILSSELICGYDPNDKLVYPAGVGAENYTLFSDSLEYTIRFQNTGNDTAFTIVIRDTLDANLDLESFRPISSSHTVSTSVESDSRIATFTFEDIYLPDSFVNEPGSHGFVKFEIKSNTNLENFTPIENTAGIFFDFNPPIFTNTVQNSFTDNIPMVFFGKILLEGAYETEGLMSTDLINLIPLDQPFINVPFDYQGTELLNNIPENMVDWVLVEARTGTPNLAGSKGTSVVETQAGILLDNGNILNSDGTTGIRFTQLSIDEDYYFCIRHKNHLAVLSATSVSGSEEIYYDFTQNSNAAFGPEQLKVMDDGKVVLYAGDANQDGVILNTDFDIWFENNALINSYDAADFNLDGINQTTDYDLWFLNKAKVGVIEVQY